MTGHPSRRFRRRLDVAAIMEYPSRAAFLRIVTLPEVAEIGVHREAGLEGQLLIMTESM